MRTRLSSAILLSAMLGLPACLSSPQQARPSPPAALTPPAAASPAQADLVPPAPPGFGVRRCVNLAALEAPNEGEWGYAVRQADLARIREAGFDSVRLPIKASAWTGPAPAFRLDEKRMRRVDAIIADAIAARLSVILDVHHFEEIHRDPNGATAKLAAIWRQLAERYRKAPDALVFEILNEPHDRLAGDALDGALEAGLAAIRSQDGHRIVIVGGSDWSSFKGLAEFRLPPDDLRLVATAHFYTPFEFTHENASFMSPSPRFGRRWGAPEDRAALNADFDRAAAWARENNVHLFLGEFGVNDRVAPDQREDWTRTVREAAERRGMSWCAWDWATTFKIYDPKEEQWVGALRSALLGDRSAS